MTELLDNNKKINIWISLISYLRFDKKTKTYLDLNFYEHICVVYKGGPTRTRRQYSASPTQLGRPAARATTKVARCLHTPHDHFTRSGKKSKAKTIGMRQKGTSHYYFRCKGPLPANITKTVIFRLVPRIKLVKILHEGVVGFQRGWDGQYSKFDRDVIK